MIIGVLREARPGETRAAATPATVAQLIKLGYEVVEVSALQGADAQTAGSLVLFLADEYMQAGFASGRNSWVHQIRDLAGEPG